MTEDIDNPIDKQIDLENSEWLESLDDIYESSGSERVREILGNLSARAGELGVPLSKPIITDYVNTIPPEKQPPYPGSRDIERRIKSIIRWNAMAMVVRANRELDGIGGHISSYASAATLLEVGFNHFFRGKSGDHPGDIVYFQGHGAPVR